MLDPRDRGLAYGDGLFETLRVTAEGRVPLWAGHHRRLQQGARVLGLPVLPECRYQAAIAEGVAALAGEPGVVKLTLTRGPGGRGYLPPPEALESVFGKHAFELLRQESLDFSLCVCRSHPIPLWNCWSKQYPQTVLSATKFFRHEIVSFAISLSRRYAGYRHFWSGVSA